MLKSLGHKNFVALCLVMACIGLALLSESCQTAHSNGQNKDYADISTNYVPDVIDFTFHVKPILSDRCFKCHGPDEAKVEGGLQLHTEALAKAALGKDMDRFAIKAGDVQASTLLHRIFSTDPDDIMPPEDSNLSLEEYEKEILKKWIEQGAPWNEHWAFIPPEEPTKPRVENEEWVSNDIDYFILKTIEDQGLQPSAPLAKEKLLRKLSFDLRGLPPELQDIESILEDPSDKNYERLIDKYLSSVAFAERMTNDWLDPFF